MTLPAVFSVAPTLVRPAAWRATRMAFTCLIWLRHRLLRLADAVVPAELVVTEAATGGMDAAVLRVLVEAGIADLLVLEGPLSAKELSARLALDLDATSPRLQLRLCPRLFVLPPRGPLCRQPPHPPACPKHPRGLGPIRSLHD